MATPRVLNPQVMVPQSRQESRVGRRPETHFDLVFKPFQIQPMCLFPVVPGETLMNCNIQMQGWSDPLKAELKNNIWHAEFYLYYVKFRDLPGWEQGVDGLGKDLIDMFEVNESLGAHVNATGNPATGCAPGGVDFVLNALERVVDSYWRDEGTMALGGAVTLDGLPLAKLNGGGRRDVWDRLTLNSAYGDRRQNADWDASGQITMDDLEMAYREWIGQRDGPETDMDYEDWARAAGGKVVVRHEDREDMHVPEEVTGVREYLYPTNTVDPATGTPSVAVGLRWRKGARKMIRMDEWGWLLGVVCWRPKLLYGSQTGLVASMMQSRDNWFPPNYDPRSWSPHLQMLDNVGPLKGVMDATNIPYWVNLRDLFRYGEQFTNFNPVPGDGRFSNKPYGNGAVDYPAVSDCMEPFTDTTGGRLRVSGVVQVGIKTHPVVVGRDEPDSRTLAKW